jgi:nitroreductase
MQVLDALAARRTVRRFADADVPEDVLTRVLGAALAMPHAGNTYDWRAVVLRRPRETHPRWADIHAAVLNQDYLAEAPVLVVYAVQPQWWADHYRANVRRILELGLIDTARAGQLLETLESLDAPRAGHELLPGLVGEAMLGVGAVVLAAVDAGLGTALAACRPAALADALGIPPEAHVMPFGVLAIGYAADEAPARGAEKPKLSEVCYDGAWGVPLG